MNRVPKFDYRVIIEFLESLNCPRSLSVAILFRYSEFEQIVNLNFDPFWFNSLEDARLSLLATELLRKHNALPTNIDRVDVALKSFFAAEEKCRETNERLLERNAHGSKISLASRKIAAVLGSFDPEALVEFAGWGPGSTVFIKRRDASVANKFRQKTELTPALYSLVKPWFSTQFPHWAPEFRILEGNKVITVPKNAKTDRTIAVEPSLNLYFQKGVGVMIRRSLRKFGVHLDDQTINQRLALVGSKTGSLATVDFSAASDTLSSVLVLDLLPFQWFQVLDALRSPRGYIKTSDSLIEYEKFSSMGNGFTFELESLIFWALAKACVPEDHPLYSSISVFGDDVVIPSEYCESYRELCEYCGFSFNNKKSYSSGYYRESCGKHYWDGVDITPIYNRHYLVNDEIMRFHNRVGELSRRSIGEGFRDIRFRPCMKILSNSLGENFPRVPDGYGDLGLVTSLDEVCPTFCRTLQRGWYAKSIIAVTKGIYEDDDSVRLSALYHQMKKGGLERYDLIPTGNQINYSSRGYQKRKKLWYPDWPCLGPWI